MPRSAPIKSLPRTHAAAAALKEVLEGRMAAGIDHHLAETATRPVADRRNGSYRRWLMIELGDIEVSVPRTRSFSALAVVRAYARRSILQLSRTS